MLGVSQQTLFRTLGLIVRMNHLIALGIRWMLLCCELGLGDLIPVDTKCHCQTLCSHGQYFLIPIEIIVVEVIRCIFRHVFLFRLTLYVLLCLFDQLPSPEDGYLS